MRAKSFKYALVCGLGVISLAAICGGSYQVAIAKSMSTTGVDSFSFDSDSRLKFYPEQAANDVSEDYKPSDAGLKVDESGSLTVENKETLDDFLEKHNGKLEIFASWNVTTISDSAFHRVGKLKSVIIPPSVKKIENMAFYQNGALSFVQLSEGLESIGPYAFEAGIFKEIFIPSSVTEMAGSVFNKCDKLESVFFKGKEKESFKKFDTQVSVYPVFPNKNISFYFENEKLLEFVEETLKNGLPDFFRNYSFKLVSISDDFAVEGEKNLIRVTPEAQAKKELTVPVQIETIANGAFSSCEELAIVKFDENSKLQAIGNGAFMNCLNLKKLLLPETLKIIGDNAFENCTDLMDFVIPSNVTRIGISAFQNCTILTGITIPYSVKEVGEKAFGGCSNLESVTFQGNNFELSLGSGTFPKGVKYFYFEEKDLFDKFRSSQANAGIVESRCYWINQFFNVNSHRLTKLTSEGQDASELSIPNVVSIINTGVFNENTKCTKVIIPSSVTVIEKGAFSGCKNLKEVVIYNDAISINEAAFTNLPKDTQYYIPVINYEAIQTALMKNGIEKNQIHRLSEQNSPSNVDYTIIGIVAGAVILSIITLGLGIAIPMRKQHKINVLNAKITQKRIERLSSATALSFKKVLEVSNQTMSDIKTLKEQVKGLPSSPNRISSPERRRPPVVPDPVKPNKPKN